MEHKLCLGYEVGTPLEVLVPSMTRALQRNQTINKQAIGNYNLKDPRYATCKILRVIQVEKQPGGTPL